MWHEVKHFPEVMWHAHHDAKHATKHDAKHAANHDATHEATHDGKAHALEDTAPSSVRLLTAWHDSVLAGEGSYERFVASAVLWLHRMLQPPSTPPPAPARAPHHRNASSTAIAALQRMGMCSAVLTSWLGEEGRFEPSVAYGASLRLLKAAREEAGSGGRVESGGGGALLLRMVEANHMHSPLQLRATLRDERCVPLTSVGSGQMASVHEAGPPPMHWMQREEAAAATHAGVPLLSSYDYRLRQPGLHPAIQRGDASNLANRFDCSHSSFASGAYDAEVAGLLGLLVEARVTAPRV
jgi:hypothetical protein